MYKKGFTLAEIMIVLTVIGILTAILLPAAIHSTPNENVMKFKKAHNTLYKVINELVNSDKYYTDGDLGIRAQSAAPIDGAHTGDYTYFCNSVADVLSTKGVNCSESGNAWTGSGSTEGLAHSIPVSNLFDSECKSEAANVGAEITTTDDIIFYSAFPKSVFGNEYFYWMNNGVGYDSAHTYNPKDPSDTRIQNGLYYYLYKVFCIDVDGIDYGEDPFGYGIRVDGKIQPGPRAQEWLNKSIQEKE